MGTLYSKARTPFARSIFASEMVLDATLCLLNLHLQTQLRILSKKGMKGADKALSSFATDFTANVFSSSANSEDLWSMIVSKVYQKHRVRIGRNEMAWGYLLGGYIARSNLKFNLPLVDKASRFGEEDNCINTHLSEGFLCKFTTTDLSTNDLIDLNDILENQPSESGFKRVKTLLENIPLLQSLKHLNIFKRILVYMANFVSPNLSSYKDSLNPYEHIPN